MMLELVNSGRHSPAGWDSPWTASAAARRLRTDSGRGKCAGAAAVRTDDRGLATADALAGRLPGSRGAGCAAASTDTVLAVRTPSGCATDSRARGADLAGGFAVSEGMDVAGSSPM